MRKNFLYSPEDCGLISSNITKNCDNPIVGGVADNIYLFNWADWILSVFDRDEENPEIYEGITLPSGAFAYKMEGINNSPAPLQTFKRLAFGTNYEHAVNYYVFSLGAAVKKQLEAKGKGRFVAVVENNYRGTAGETAFEIYGANAGLIVPDGGITRDPNNADSQGAYFINLISSEKAREPHLPATFFKTDYATTKALLDALVAE